MTFVFEGGEHRRGLLVLLGREEIDLGAQVARRRQSEAARMRLPDKHGFKGDGLSIHLLGAYGEIAVAGATGIQWCASINTFKRGGDVGDFQVRARTADYYDLLIRDDDPPDSVFWLVLGHAPLLRVVGWVVARDGMKTRYRACHGGREEAWFVPQAALNPFNVRPPMTKRHVG